MPHFLRSQALWKGVLDPKTHLGPNAKFRDLRAAAGSHRWKLDSKEYFAKNLSKQENGLIDVALSILERGVWTIPSWRMEQYLASLFEKHLDWSISVTDPLAGRLGFSVEKSKLDVAFQQALVTASWQVEASDDAVDEIWNSQASCDSGSEAEREFLENVLAPALGHPLLDYLHLQADLVSLGLDPIQFSGQRPDFVLDTGRGLKLVIEVDGYQHKEEAQALLDRKRDSALANEGWTVWRVTTDSDIQDRTGKLKLQLGGFLNGGAPKGDGLTVWKYPSGFKGRLKPFWGIDQQLKTPRTKALLSCVWGATVSARIQFLLLEALRQGVLLWDGPWMVGVVEQDTEVADEALEDFSDWFGRLRELYGFVGCPVIQRVQEEDFETAQLIVDISIIHPYRRVIESSTPVVWSRPANCVASVPKRKFSTRMAVSEAPSEYLIESFIQDYLRNSGLREGQQQIISRILMGQDVIGLLPTGGGKSLTYQLCGLLLGGLTIYVSPLKSLLQDQRERLMDLGIDLAYEISSALTASQREEATRMLTSGGIRYLLIAPERFLIDKFRSDLSQFRVQFGEVSQVVVDECHCVSEWGHDFRPAYLSLSRIVKDRTQRLNVSAPLIALTGTASSIVLSDVQRELGVTENEAVIRAKRLDRPEITMTCQKLPQKQKHYQLKEIVGEFLINNERATEGLLLFCRFIGGLEGVLGVTSSVLGVVPQENLRFYCGSDPDWRQFISFWKKKKKSQVSEQEAEQLVPSWAVAPNGKLRDWDEVKSQNQRDFISGLPGGYQVLVATNAFGMGIDKPSVRQVIHFMTPQSPEAYYQEVGRAGRDKKESSAVLLFSDEDAGVTDKILDPGTSIDDARKVYKEYTDTNKYQGGDFIRTFYFHQNSFSGPDDEARFIVTLLKAIRQRLVESNSLNFAYVPSGTDGYGLVNPDQVWKQEKNLEYAVVRLIILGVVKDYTKDYNGKRLELVLATEWTACRDETERLSDYMASHFRQYVNRYQVYLENNGESRIRGATTILDIENTTASVMVEYVYEKIERKRRQASRQMLEFARMGAVDPEGFRQALMSYLQVSEKFTRNLEDLARDSELLAWKDLVVTVDSRDEIKELHGACQRVLESYPTHPGLLSISAVTRLNPSDVDLKRSEEEFKAALQYSTKGHGLLEAKTNGDEVVSYAEEVDVRLSNTLQNVFGIWLIGNGRKEEATKRFFRNKGVREHLLAGVLREVRNTVPVITEI